MTDTHSPQPTDDEDAGPKFLMLDRLASARWAYTDDGKRKMALQDMIRNQVPRINRFWRKMLSPNLAEHFQRLTLGLIPTQFLAPSEQFRKKGWNQLIYDSAPLEPGASVAVIGAFKGDSVEAWLRNYPGINLFAYEPVPQYFQELRPRFRDSKVNLYNFGISEKDEFRDFAVLGASTTGDSWRAGNLGGEQLEKSIRVKFKSLEHAVSSWPSFVDVLEINIEGGEFELLEIFAKGDMLGRVGQVFVQFHDVGPSTPDQVQKSRQLLRNTHSQIWCFDMVWELWGPKQGTRR